MRVKDSKAMSANDLPPTLQLSKGTQVKPSFAAKTLAKLAHVESELEKCRAKEYELPFGSMRRARMSRKWDHFAQRRMALLQDLEIATARETLTV